jgi:hypothetical protein
MSARKSVLVRLWWSAPVLLAGAVGGCRKDTAGTGPADAPDAAAVAARATFVVYTLPG